MHILDQKNGVASGRVLALWLGSFVIVASFLYFHFGVPLFPIGLAGVFTLGVTLVRYLSRKSEVTD